jgi:hypothetical protein
MRYLLLALHLLAFSLHAQNLKKIDPSLFDAFQDGKAPFFIVMTAQADIAQANNLTSKEAKGQFVFDRLYNTAEQSQAPIKAILKAQNIDFQSFWIVNALYTKGDKQLIEQLAQREDVAQIVSNPKAKHELPSLQEPASLETRGSPQLAWGVAKIKADSVWALGLKVKMPLLAVKIPATIGSILRLNPNIAAGIPQPIKPTIITIGMTPSIKTVPNRVILAAMMSKYLVMTIYMARTQWVRCSALTILWS